MYKGVLDKGIRYLIFLLYAEILGILVKKSREIMGITIDDTVYRWSQYPDDTSLILDGYPASLDASLRLLQLYAEISGLKINLEKKCDLDR